jgi:peroxiredoxin Q/BCP
MLLETLIVASLLGQTGSTQEATKDAAKEPAKPAVDLKVGDPAPKFVALDDTGKEWKSEDHVGKGILVVYFYPADMTGGCTKEACGYRDDLTALKEKGVEVVGVSANSVAEHQMFKKEKSLNFALLADPDGKVATQFGVPTQDGGSYKATIDGKEQPFTVPIAISRWTFVVGKDGKIASKNTAVNAAEDSKAILATVAMLQK